MTYTFIPPSVDEFDNLFLGGVGRGGGLGDIKIFHPVQRSRRGGGLFTFLGGLAKKAAPFLFRNVAPEVVRMGRGVLEDVIQGKKIRSSLKNRGIEAIKGVGRRVTGGGVRRRGVIRKKKKQARRQLKKKKCYKNDIFTNVGVI